MSLKHASVKGMQDILPPDVHIWQTLEAAARETFRTHGFREIRTPILEHTTVFTRSIGENTDIVEKEMYTFDDKGGRSLTMRPECTASVVRSFVQHHLGREALPLKLFYIGPMFRYERPQKGRLRQFHQIGVEGFGPADARFDAEVMAMLMSFLSRAGIGGLSLEINSIGCPQCRPAFRETLVAFFDSRRDSLCADCSRRLEHNPLRVLDCKVPGCIEQRGDAPVVSSHLCPSCSEHFEALKAALDRLAVPYRHNPEMVRGLDYYTSTTFEVTTDRLGAQNAVAAGGRYDSLVHDFGGPHTPAIGFAVGMERLVELLRQEDSSSPPSPDVYIAPLGDEAAMEGLSLAAALRARGLWTELGGGGSLKNQLRRADKMGAACAVIIGDEELAKGSFNYRLMQQKTSGEASLSGAADFLSDLLAPRP